MGVIFEQFHSINYENEADVSQNFVITLLTKYLGFSLEDIKPERDFPARDIFYGRKKINSKDFPKSQRPDYVICINDISNPKFVVESKAPSEELEKHLPQMQSYSLGVGVNLLVITNGVSLRIYDVNNLIFKANNIEDLDLNFDIVKKILCKEVQACSSPLEIIKSIDIDKALGKSSIQLIEEEKRKLQLKISDFQEYLKNVKEQFQDWQIPREFQAFSLKIEQYPPDRLHRFKIYKMSKISLGEEKSYTFAEIEQKFNTPIKIFIGPSGIGKTTLLKYIAYLKASDCLNLHNVEIPIYIPLRNFGHNLGLENLIIKSLGKRGFNTSSQDLQKLLQKNTFIFLLDAFDEVQEKYLEDAKREIEEFTGINTNKIIITSRETRLIDLPSSSRFLVNPLEQNEIENLLEQYLGNERFKFLHEIKRKGLVDESKNTLLLTLMILIYKEDQILPISRTKIVGKVVEKIKEWEESKGKRLTNGLSWGIKEKILSELAFKIVEAQENLTLSEKQFDSVLIPLLECLEEKREIPQGIDKHRVIEDLALTGIVGYDDDAVSFWHRAFLNYFASKTLADKYVESPKILEEIKNKVAWEPIIVGSVEHLYDSTKFIETLRDTNLFLASACLGEAKKISEHTIKDIVSQLSIKCFSPINEIRLRAIWFLKRINPTYTIDVFFGFLENNPYPDIRKIAIEEAAKEKSSRARMAVYKLIDWDERGGIFLGSTQGSIAKALSNFDVDDQLKIIKIWRTKPDIFTSEDCEEAIRNIIREGGLTERVKEALLDFYLEKEEGDIHKHHKDRGLADILIEISDEKIVPKLIESFEVKNSDSLDGMRTEDILASYKLENVIEQLSSKALDQKIGDKIREGCSGALSKSKGMVPLSIFEKLLEDKNPRVRRNAIKSLDRFPTSEVKDLLLIYVNDKDGRAQYEAIKVLGDKGLLVELADKNKFPKRFYDISVEVLLEQTRKYKLREMLPILDWLKDKVRNDDRKKIDVAHAYSIIGEKEKAKKIIESFFHENELVVSEYGLADLAEISPVFDPPYSLRIIKEVLKSINKLSDKSSFWVDKCIESLERIGNIEALDLLKELATGYAAKRELLLIERSLRAINSLATNKDEEWYINFIKRNSHLERSDLRRAIEGLGIVGSEKSIPVIKEIAALHKKEEYIIAICFLSIENIYRNSGILIEITEKEVLNENN
ncbi:MAG: HEAT repeat domain-containing protein [Candidatus Methanoperedens sp.]|nr:HEAT repeat domain-containing protein [Candidatus Methanoperedens sp.]